MKPLKIAQISDLHFTTLTWNPFLLFSKRFLGNLNWLLKRKETFGDEPLNALPPLLATLGLDYVFLGGDFTSTSLPQEFAKARTFVNQLSTPWIAVPGNHDHYTYTAYSQKRFYQSLPNQPSFHSFRLDTHGVEAHQLNEHWWVIALDTALATNLYSSHGLFSQKIENTLQELLALLPPDSSILLLNHYPFFQNDIPRHSLRRGEQLEALLRKEPRIKAYLHGHSHRHTVADLQVNGLPLILDSGSAADRQIGTWNLLTIDDKQIQIDTYRWKNGWKLSNTEQVPLLR